MSRKAIMVTILTCTLALGVTAATAQEQGPLTPNRYPPGPTPPTGSQGMDAGGGAGTDSATPGGSGIPGTGGGAPGNPGGSTSLGGLKGFGSTRPADLQKNPDDNTSQPGGMGHGRGGMGRGPGDWGTGGDDRQPGGMSHGGGEAGPGAVPLGNPAGPGVTGPAILGKPGGVMQPNRGGWAGSGRGRGGQ